MAINWFKYSSPASFFPLAGRLAPWFVVAGLGLVGVAVLIG